MRLLISTRETAVTYPSGDVEIRDALAADWEKFLSTALPDAVWLTMPNLSPDRAVRTAETFGADGLVLSGGEDVGQSPRRDAAEKALLDWAAQRGLPVLGVCRGAQLLHLCGGGVLQDMEGHARIRHPLVFTGGEQRSVLSYHHNVIAAPCPLAVPLAHAADGTVEAFTYAGRPWLGIMWHPEREAEPQQADVNLIRQFFGGYVLG